MQGDWGHNAECVFLERMLENHYNSYASCAYTSRRRRWYLALKRNGHAKSGAARALCTLSPTN